MHVPNLNYLIKSSILHKKKEKITNVSTSIANLMQIKIPLLCYFKSHEFSNTQSSVEVVAISKIGPLLMYSNIYLKIIIDLRILLTYEKIDALNLFTTFRFCLRDLPYINKIKERARKIGNRYIGDVRLRPRMFINLILGVWGWGQYLFSTTFYQFFASGSIITTKKYFNKTSHKFTDMCCLSQTGTKFRIDLHFRHKCKLFFFYNIFSKKSAIHTVVRILDFWRLAKLRFGFANFYTWDIPICAGLSSIVKGQNRMEFNITIYGIYS